MFRTPISEKCQREFGKLNALVMPQDHASALSNGILPRASILSNLISVMCCYTQFSAVPFDPRRIEYITLE